MERSRWFYGGQFNGLLTDSGVPVDSQNGMGVTKPRSRRKDNTAVIRTLTSHGALVNATNYELKTPLLVAVAEGAVKQTQTLLDIGANVMTRDAEGNTVLHLAASSPSCSPSMLTWLVGKGLTGRRLLRTHRRDRTIEIFIRKIWSLAIPSSFRGLTADRLCILAPYEIRVSDRKWF